MRSFTSHDGTKLAYHVLGDGEPLVCVPGGAGRAAEYLGDLGGLHRHRQLILLDNRGTGGSDEPEDKGTYRCDRLAADVEALREHLGLGTMDLLGHSAGGGVALHYTARYPQRLRKLVLVTAVARPAGIVASEEDMKAVWARRAGEPWYPAAIAAWDSGEPSSEVPAPWDPLFYGRWDDQARAHAAADPVQRNPEAAAGYFASGAFTPEATVPLLAQVQAPVLVLGGELDGRPSAADCAALAELFPAGETVVQPGGGHFPWLDDPAWFTSAVEGFLSR
ncbi:alpha/beta fold hydrolase [Longispora albida]|uniref:alpha/beta fold hydrolase n=1 Tax=Longispora albida TaxID=203523 RepID=UPI000378BCE7|nr:alpha/beta hydrolase [Longispora albida]